MKKKVLMSVVVLSMLAFPPGQQDHTDRCYDSECVCRRAETVYGKWDECAFVKTAEYGETSGNIERVSIMAELTVTKFVGCV